MKKCTVLIIVSCLSVFIVNAQTNKEQALAKGKEAIALIDEGKLAESVALFEEARKLDPEDIVYPYELALAKYQLKDYDGAVKLLKELVKKKKANGRVYAMLGNVYDDMGKTQKAIDTYEEGIKLFPEVGNIYMERGLVEMKRKEYDKALGYFEAGIKADPLYPSNYYRAAKLFLDSQQEVWGMIYGEMFMNLERGSKRTEEISKLLYYTYKGEIKFENDTMKSVSFYKTNNTITLPVNIQEGKENNLLIQLLNGLRNSFGSGVYEITLSMAIVDEKVINLASLNRIRTNFLRLYEELGHQEKKPVVLFDFQRKVQAAGHLEAYNYWVLGQGDEKALGEWTSEHPQQWTDFMKWFKDNKIEITADNQFYRKKYL
jgi:tetratricopeptide (TPR) repeat protein